MNPQIRDLLDSIAQLLRDHGETGWASALAQLEAEYDADPSGVRGKVLALYGGMGSFNDVVLYDAQGQMLCNENDRLHLLRTQLHAACRRDQTTDP